MAHFFRGGANTFSRRIAIAATITLAGAGAFACGEHPVAPSQTASFSASASYARLLRDQRSMGRLHNEYLRRMKARLLAARSGHGGRRLTKSEICDVIGAVLFETLPPRTPARLVAQLLDRKNPTCSFSTQPRFSSTASAPSRVAFDAYDDELDSLIFNIEWDHANDSLPSAEEDSATVAVAVAAVALAVEGSSNVADAQAAIQAAIAQLNASSAAAAELIGHIGTLGAFSIAYWATDAEIWNDSIEGPECDSLCTPEVSNREHR
jgi:hypothetical protein